MVLNNDTIKVNCYTIKRIDQNIIEISMEDNYHIELEDNIALKEKILQIEKNTEDISFLFVSGEHTTISKEAREYSSRNRIYCKAEAVVVHKLYQRIIVNFMINFNKKSKANRNMKIFTDRQEGLKWIQTHY